MLTMNDQDYTEFFASTDKYVELKDLHRILGSEALTRLLECYGGNEIYIPKLSEIQRTKRDKLIRKQSQNGYSCRDLAVRYNLTVSTIRKIVAHGKSSDVLLKED